MWISKDWLCGYKQCPYKLMAYRLNYFIVHVFSCSVITVFHITMLESYAILIIVSPCVLSVTYNCIKFYWNILNSLKLQLFGRATFSCSVVQQQFNIHFPWSLGYTHVLELISIWVSLGKLFHWQCVKPKYGAKEYQICTDTVLSGYQFRPRSSGAVN